MSASSLNNTEKEINLFVSRIHVDGISQTVEIHEIDMCGWYLFERFLHPAQTVVYIGWDDEANAPEWIDMEDDATEAYAQSLTNLILEFKKKAKAA